MKYKAVYDVLNERRQTTPGFCYHDRSGWRAYPQTYMTMQCPLWIIAEDAATGRRLWITQEGTRFSISIRRMDERGRNYGPTYRITGVHIGQHDLPAAAVRKVIGENMLLGVSASSIAEAIQAQQDGADYLGVGAMFPTGTKTDADSVSMEELQKIRAAVSLPIVVIGGINKGNAGRFKPMGIDGLAVVSAIIAQSDIKAAAAELKDLFCGKEKKNGF